MIDLGFSKTELGILGSILSLTYGVSKFLSGVLADRSNPRFFMATGLILTGCFNICFGLSSSILFFSVFWALNGLFQGWGWPPCARLLNYWYSQKERGTWWGLWNTSQTLGGALIPIIVTFCITHWNWRIALYVPGALSIIVGFFVLYTLRDTPQSLGLPPIEKFRDDYPGAKNLSMDESISTKEILIKYILKNGYLWILSFAYFFLYMIRTAVNDWSILYFMETKGYSGLTAASCIFAFEIGGFCGSFMAGAVSDKVFKGRRGPVNVIYSLGILLCLTILYLSGCSQLYLNYLNMFCLGFCVFGPQMLIGMVSTEVSHKRAVGTASGFSGCWSYAGAAMAGYPLGVIAQHTGWSGFFTILIGASVLGLMLLLPLWSITNNPKYHSSTISKK